MKQPLVSFCMSTYKRPGFLLKQLKCLLNQTYQNIEIVVSDNDTEQSGKKAVDAVNDPRIKYFPNNSNLGMVASFNASIARSGGEYIVMITDDDPAYPHMLTDLIALLNQYPGYGVYGGCGDWLVENEFAASSFGQSTGKTSFLLPQLAYQEVKCMQAADFATAYLDGFFSGTFLLWSCLMVERKVLVDAGGMPDYGSELLTDHAYVMAIGSVKGMVYINEAMGAQAVHGGNFGYNIFKLKEKYIHTPAWFIRYLEDQLKAMPAWPLIQKKIRDFAGRAWVEYSLQIARSLREKKEKKEFRKLFHSAFKNKSIHKWKYKFYLKYHFRPAFDLLIKLKGK